MPFVKTILNCLDADSHDVVVILEDLIYENQILKKTINRIIKTLSDEDFPTTVKRLGTSQMIKEIKKQVEDLYEE